MAVKIAAGGAARCAIWCAPDATEAERWAADELARWLGEATGARFEVRTLKGPAPANAILVGPSSAAQEAVGAVALDRLGPEELLVVSRGGRLVLAGGRPRGTVYAVFRFLERAVGIRWWTPWATEVPKKRYLVVDRLSVREKPAFESRVPFWYVANDGDWSARNLSNAHSSRLGAKHGGRLRYLGFVHTFYPLVPPEKHFAEHPEWYSMDASGKRYVSGGQLCTTNPGLRAFLVEQLRSQLKANPDANIVSISQNDWFGACLCPECKALDTAEGSSAGTMLSLVNHVADALGPEFPSVAFDTLAYQYTRRAPRTAAPRPNVIVRLCSIECNFRQPLDAPANQSFGDDLRAWGRRSNRLYIWDYTTNFAHYLLPHPNWFQMARNVRFFRENGVRGLFEQGAYQCHGAEMAEMRAWVLAQLLWNPFRDDKRLISEFLEGYYGPPSGRLIWRYLELMHRRTETTFLSCYARPGIYDFATLSEADAIWAAAERATETPERRWRVQQGRNCVRYAVLANWSTLRKQCKATGGVWPWGEAPRVAREFLALATGPGPKGWQPITHLSEGGLTPQAFAVRFADVPEDRAPLPADLSNAAGAVPVQESAARLYKEGELASRRDDPTASDGKALAMPGTHTEWAVQVPVEILPEKLQEGRWRIYVVARVEAESGRVGAAFQAGVYDTGARKDLATKTVTLTEVGATYASFDLGVAPLDPEVYIWVAPVVGTGVKTIWVDRFVFVPA